MSMNEDEIIFDRNQREAFERSLASLEGAVQELRAKVAIFQAANEKLRKRVDLLEMSGL